LIDFKNYGGFNIFRNRTSYNARRIVKLPELSSICILLGAHETFNRRNPKEPSGPGGNLSELNARSDIGKGDPKIRIAFFIY
jgi:hypothetical protein